MNNVSINIPDNIKELNLKIKVNDDNNIIEIVDFLLIDKNENKNSATTTTKIDEFISFYFDHEKGYKLAVKKIYDLYLNWCEEDDKKPLGKQKFIKFWETNHSKEYPIKQKVRPSYGGDSTKCIINLIPKVKNNDTLPKAEGDEEDEEKKEEGEDE